MEYINSERLLKLFATGAVIGWASHFYHQLQRPGIEWLEAAFGGAGVLLVMAAVSAAVAVRKIRTNAIADDPGFYAKGARRFILISVVIAASVGLIVFGISGHR